jgi:hypothetical protein
MRSIVSDFTENVMKDLQGDSDENGKISLHHYVLGT